MPWTSNRVSDNKAFSERAAIVRAMSRDSKKIFSLSHQQDGLSLRVPEKAGAVIQLLFRNSLREIGSAQLGFFQFVVFLGSVLSSVRRNCAGYFTRASSNDSRR
jgi:hypothetical protein